MGIIFKGPAFLIYFICGFWGLSICFHIVQDIFGTFLAFISLFLFPMLIAFAPWYEGLVNGDWMALMVIYGGGIVATGLVFIGSSIDGD